MLPRRECHEACSEMPRLTFRHRGYTQHSRRTDAPQCTPPIRTVTVGAGISPAQPPSFGEGGSRTITAGSDFHRPRSTRLPLCHAGRVAARGVRGARTGRGPSPVPLIGVVAISECGRSRARAAPPPRGGRPPRETPPSRQQNYRHQRWPRARWSRARSRRPPESRPPGRRR